MRSVVRFACLLATVLLGCSSAHQDEGTSDEGALNEAKQLGMTDVTILYPVNKSAEFFDDYMGPTSEVDKGELLPAAVFQQLAPIKSPPMVNADGTPLEPNRLLFKEWVDNFPLLRVTGIRLDPCFGESQNLGNADCMNTIRLVAQFWQPNHSNLPDGKSAIHLIYKISRDEFKALAKGMLDLRLASGLPLQKGLASASNTFTHPTITSEGMRGTYANGLKNLILKYAGEKTLTRIAFCVEDRVGQNAGGYYAGQSPVDSRWVFGGFDYERGQLRPAGISSLNNYTGLQTADSSPSFQRRDSLVVQPAVTIQDNIFPALVIKAGTNGAIDQAAAAQAKAAALNLMNPMKYTAKNADCVSCHMSKQANPNHAPDANEFKSYSFRLDRQQDVAGPFRHFGFDVQGNPVVSGRVVNETAVVLEYLNKYVLP